MKYLLLALLLAGCGSGGGSTPIIQTVEEIEPTEHICPDCNGTVVVETQYITVTEYVTEYIDPFELDENDTRVHIAVWYNRKDMEADEFRNSGIEGGVLTIDGRIPADPYDSNGTTVVEAAFKMYDDRTVMHHIGLRLYQDGYIPTIYENN